jgi:NADH:ubiquinone oxidoreductase subunit E
MFIFDCNVRKVTFDNMKKVYLIPSLEDIQDIKNNIWWSESELETISKKLEMELQIVQKVYNITSVKEAFNLINHS